MCINKLILGDNFEILKAMNSETVDNDGLENIETIKLKVNGIIETYKVN